VTGGAAALAVYELTDQRPPGHTVGGITYRDDVAGDRLVGAEIGRAGQGEVTLDVEIPEGAVRVGTFCSGAPPGTWTHLEIEGLGTLDSGDCAGPSFDPGSSNYSTWNNGIGHALPGDRIRLRLWLTAGEDGALVEPDGVRIGLGVYDVAGPARPVDRVAGWALPDVREHDGHVWQLSGYGQGMPGMRDVEFDDSEPERTLVLFFSSHVDDGTVRVSRNGVPTGDHYSTDGGSGVVGDTTYATGLYTVHARGDVGPRVRLGLAAYDRID
jgi:hypothetical protein